MEKDVLKIYVASSWRNNFQQLTVSFFREMGYEVYDFRHPTSGDMGFSWGELDPNWQSWSVADYNENLKKPKAISGFNNDKDSMDWADVCVLVLPCGSSAHSEAGFMAGEGKLTYVYAPEPFEPELMYKLFYGVYSNLKDVYNELQTLQFRTV